MCYITGNNSKSYSGQDDRELGGLDMYSKYIPNVDLFICMHVLREATPLINAEKFNEVVGISMPSSYKLVSDLGKIKVLK